MALKKIILNGAEVSLPTKLSDLENDIGAGVGVVYIDGYNYDDMYDKVEYCLHNNLPLLIAYNGYAHCATSYFTSYASGKIFCVTFIIEIGSKQRLCFFKGIENNGEWSIIRQQEEIVTKDQLATINGQSLTEGGDITISGGAGNVPTKTSDLTNDSGFITANDNVASATKLANIRYLNGVPFDGSTNAINYAVCSTAASTTTKAVSISRFSLVTGSQVRVKFSNANTASAPTLNVGSSGAKRMSYKGSLITNTNFTFAVNKIYTFTYDGTYWVLEGDWDVVDTTQPTHFFQMDGGSGNTYLISRMSADSVLPTRVGDIITVFNTTSQDFNITNDTQILYDGSTTKTYSVVGESFTIKPLSSASFVLANDTTLTPIVPVVETAGGSNGANVQAVDPAEGLDDVNEISGGGSSSGGYPFEYVEVEPNQTLSLELQPNRYYEINVGGVYGGIGGEEGSVGSSTLNISIGYPLDNDTINEYLFMLDFQIDCSIILPDNILWANDKTPEFAYGKSYIISIVGYSATFAEFNGSLTI